MYVWTADHQKVSEYSHSGRVGKEHSMYTKGMNTNDIEIHMRELYDIEISDSTISRLTDKLLPIEKE